MLSNNVIQSTSSVTSNTSRVSVATTSSLAELSRDDLLAYVANWRKCLNSIQKSQWFKNLADCVQADSKNAISLLIPAKTAFGYRIKVTEMTEMSGLLVPTDLPLNKGYLLLSKLVSGIDLHTAVNSLLETARAKGINTPDKLELPKPPNITQIEINDTRASKTISSAEIARLSNTNQEVVVSVAGVWYKTIQYIANPLSFFQNKALARAASKVSGGLLIPNWYSGMVGQNEFDRIILPIDEIINKLDFVPLQKQLDGNKSCLVKISGCSIDIQTVSEGYFSIEISRPRHNLHEMHKVFEAIISKNDLKQKLIELLQKNQLQPNVILSPISSLELEADFVSTALALGDRLYFKPNKGIQGQGIFRVAKLANGRYSFDTDCAGTAQAIYGLCIQQNAGSISNLQKILFPIRRMIESAKCRFFLDVLSIGRIPQTSLNVEFSDKHELEKILQNFFVHSEHPASSYHVEKEIPMVKIDNRVVKMRLVFESEYGKLRLRGHCAELAASSVTGFAAGSARGMDTYQAFEKLCKHYPKCQHSPNDLIASLIKDSLTYLTNSFKLIKETGELDDRLHRQRNYHASENAYYEDNHGLRTIALDIGLVWDEVINNFKLYLIEANALGQTDVGMLGTRNIWLTRPELSHI